MLHEGVEDDLASVDFSPFFAGVTVQMEVKILLLFYYDRAMYWACAGIKYGI